MRILPSLKLNFVLSVSFLCLFFIPSNLALAASKEKTFDALHYIIRSSFDRENKTYFGDVTIQVKPLKDGFSTLVLDSVGMKFQSITLEPEEKALSFKQSGEQIIISLGKNFTAEEIVSVMI